MQRRYVALAVVVLLAFTGLTAIYLVRGSSGRTATSSNTAHFTIYMSEKGFNGSAAFTSPWPVMRVTQGQTVTIRVINAESVEAHGFEIDHYFTGISLRPNQFYDVTFVADQAGTFRVYCNIFCAVHSLMQNGQLVVTA
jgi:FtsP/CotA-like multicopper oxidase with cupredoxin domain